MRAHGRRDRQGPRRSHSRELRRQGDVLDAPAVRSRKRRQHHGGVRRHRDGGDDHSWLCIICLAVRARPARRDPHLLRRDARESKDRRTHLLILLRRLPCVCRERLSRPSRLARRAPSDDCAAFHAHESLSSHGDRRHRDDDLAVDAVLHSGGCRRQGHLGERVRVFARGRRRRLVHHRFHRIFHRRCERGNDLHSQSSFGAPDRHQRHRRRGGRSPAARREVRVAALCHQPAECRHIHRLDLAADHGILRLRSLRLRTRRRPPGPRGAGLLRSLSRTARHRRGCCPPARRTAARDHLLLPGRQRHALADHSRLDAAAHQ